VERLDARSYIAEFRLRLGRGQALTYEIKAALMLATSFKILLGTSLLTTIIITILTFAGFFILGLLDFNFFKIAQKEAELSTSKYNPHLNKISNLKKTFK
jgi:hypothetical protein